jgi:uncharacterized delta-60 repeat protein
MLRHGSTTCLGFRVALTLALTGGAAAPAADGHLDTTGFHPPDGWATVDLPSLDVWAGRGALAPDGALVFAGNTEDHDLHWVRVTPTGVDSSCTVTHPDGHAVHVFDSTFDSEGRLLVVGKMWNSFVSVYQPFFARFLYPDCLPDPDFIGEGFAFEGTNSDTTPVRIATVWVGLFPLRTERIVIAAYDSDGRSWVYRYREDGDDDTSFGINGNRELAGWEPEQRVYLRDMAIDDEGRILVAGHVGVCFPCEWNAYLHRILPDGEDDTTFMIAGLIPRNWDYVAGGSSSCLALAISAEGDHYCAGVADTSGTTPRRFAVTRLAPQGQVLETVARASTDFYNTCDLALQGDGRLVVAGTSSEPGHDLFVTALTVPALDFDPEFGDTTPTDPFTALDLGIPVNATDCSMRLDGSGRPVVFTDFQVSGGLRIGAVARLENRYVFADGFESGDRSRW